MVHGVVGATDEGGVAELLPTCSYPPTALTGIELAWAERDTPCHPARATTRMDIG